MKEAHVMMIRCFPAEYVLRNAIEYVLCYLSKHISENFPVPLVSVCVYFVIMLFETPFQFTAIYQISVDHSKRTVKSLI